MVAGFFASCSVVTMPASPAIPAHKAAGCLITGHSAVGLIEITLDGGGISQAECIETITVRGGVSDVDLHVEHVSDTVKRVRINVAGTPADGLGFCASFSRVPGGH